jgi:ABC-type multidrug transport system fused ATPase/permease subunit
MISQKYLNNTVVMEYLALLNNSKLFTGLTMIMMNMGSRYVLADISQMQEQIMKHALFKKLILFCMFFVGTRDVLLAAILTFAFSAIVHGLLNEHSRYNLLPRSLQTIQNLDTMRTEYERAKRMVEKYEQELNANNVVRTSTATYDEVASPIWDESKPGAHSSDAVSSYLSRISYLHKFY